jgi:phosphatidylinositol alpha-1,6-mannosyltransferase
MKILLVTADFPPVTGGIQTYSYEIAKNLHELGVDVLVLAPKDNGYKEFDQNQDIKIIRKWLPSNYYLMVMVSSFYLLYYATKYKINLIHCATWLPCGVASLFIYKLFKKSYLLTTYALDILEPQTSNFRMRIMKAVLLNAKKVIAISDYTKNILLKEGIQKRNIEVIALGVEYSRFIRAVDISDLVEKYEFQGKKVILTVATLLYPYKGHDRVIKALPKVLKEVPNVVYLIVGEGPLGENLEKLVKKLNLEGKVIFAGFVHDSDLPKYYNACDVFIMPSGGDEKKGHVEGFGLVYLEANACGKPVIGGRCGGTVDAIVDGETGLLVNPSDIDEIAEALIKILKDKKYADYLGINGRKRVEKEFNWRLIAERTREVYNSVIK